MGNGHSRGSKFGPHEHSLCLRYDQKLNEEIKCKLCAKSLVNAPFYACDLCKYYVHKLCGDLPLQIDHSFHPSHPLHLFGSVSTWCDSCYRDFIDSAFYKCEKCHFKMDIKCAILPSATPSKEGQLQCLQHFSHPHSLSLSVRCNVNCFACVSKFSGPAYGCAHCNFFLHKYCAKFPREISQHSLHPLHGSLSLVVSCESITCGVCETTKFNRCNFNFKCGQCSFRLCWKCNIRVKRSIKCEDHEHALCFVEKTGRHSYSLDQCNGCDSYCRNPLIFENSEEFKRTKSSIFRCLDCDFILHLLCGPLPSTIKHECHIHSLTLLDSLVEDDYGEYYCDVCETERDPRIRLYYCKNCKYFAQVHCVVSKIVNVLSGDLKGVELKTLGKDSWARGEIDELLGDDSTAMTLKDLIDQIVDEEEKKELKRYYKWNANWSKDSKAEKPPLFDERSYFSGNKISEILKLSSFTASDFTAFCGELQDHCSDRRLELTGSDLGLKMVKVKGYIIPRSLAGVLETLLNERGDRITDISQGSIMSIEMKSFVLFILCRVVKRMRATLVRDITKHLLREWFFHVRFVKNQGFKIGFALGQVESLVDVYLALQAERLEDEVPAEINKKMAEAKRKMDDLRKEMAGLMRDLHKCKEFQGLISRKSEYMKYCLKKASECRWRNAFDGHFVGSSSAPREQWKW